MASLCGRPGTGRRSMRSTRKPGIFVAVQALGAVAVVPLALADLPSGTLLQNGSFEQPQVSSRQIFSAIPSWAPTAQCDANGDDIAIDTSGGAADGNQYVELNSACVNGITQTAATTPGAS